VQCGTPELRAFLAYIGNGREAEGGRWVMPAVTRKFGLELSSPISSICEPSAIWLFLPNPHQSKMGATISNIYFVKHIAPI
jgi:hypothetical protein